MENSMDNDLIKRNLQQVIDNVTTEIKEHGVASLFTDGQYVHTGKIIIEIDENMIPTIRYERDIVVKGY